MWSGQNWDRMGSNGRKQGRINPSIKIKQYIYNWGPLWYPYLSHFPFISNESLFWSWWISFPHFLFVCFYYICIFMQLRCFVFLRFVQLLLYLTCPCATWLFYSLLKSWAIVSWCLQISGLAICSCSIVFYCIDIRKYIPLFLYLWKVSWVSIFAVCDSLDSHSKFLLFTYLELEFL